jgi:hypothetical protein
MEPLDDQELNAILREWQAPPAPTGLRGAVFPRAASPWWRRVWRAEIRIPVPLAVCLALLILAGLWTFSSPPPPPQPARAADVVTFRELKPVKELKPRIIRRQHEEN